MPHTPEDGPEVLDRSTCLRLLRTVAVGRLAWAAADGRIEIRPVTFALDGPDVMIRCQAGSMHSAIRDGRPVSFEADLLEPALRTGWSVLVVGTGEEIGADAEQGAASVRPWAQGDRPYLVRLRAGDVTGRRLRPAAGDITIVRLDPETTRPGPSGPTTLPQ